MEYAEWIDGIFNREPVNEFELDWTDEFEEKIYYLSLTERARLIAETLENCGRDLMRFSNEQIAGGIGLILWEGYDMGGFRDPSVSVEDKRRMIAGISTLYRDIFAVRCWDEDGNLRMKENRLHFRCYMFWDAGTISLYGLKEQGEEQKILEDAVFDVLEKALYLPHYGCRQSALHGLGHTFSRYDSYGRRVEQIIDRFLESTPIDGELLEYALNAREGWVQ